MIRLPAILQSYHEKVDRSTSLRFDTRELHDAELLEIRHNKGLEGWLVFDLKEFEKYDVPEEDEGLDTKSPSTRLRNVLYVYYEQKKIKETGKTFNEFYQQQMERIIDRVKKKLD